MYVISLTQIHIIIIKFCNATSISIQVRSMLVALQQQLKFDQQNFRISVLHQLEVSLFDQLMGDHIIECEEWRRHSSLIFLIQLFTKPNQWLAISDQNTLNSHCLSTFFKSVTSILYTLWFCIQIIYICSYCLMCLFLQLRNFNCFYLQSYILKGASLECCSAC